MRIALLTNSLDPTTGGWARYSCEVARALKLAGHDVRIYTEGREGMSDFEGMPARGGLRTGIGINVQNLANIALDTLWLTEQVHDADVVHALVEHHAFSAGLTGKPYFVTAHGTYLPRFSKHWLFGVFGKSILKKATRIIFVSDFTKRKVVQNIPELTNSVFIPNGVDTDKFRPTTPPNAEHPYFITVGALKARKGQDIVVRALARISSRCPNVRYAMVGDVHEGESFVEKLRAIAKEMDVAMRLDFFSGISDEKVVELYSASLGCLLPSRTDERGAFEGFPLSLLEAASCGTPVVGARGVGAEHLIDHGVNGFLLKEEDIEGLATCMETLALEPTRRQEMGRAARAVAERFSWKAHAGAILKEYELCVRHS